MDKVISRILWLITAGVFLGYAGCYVLHSIRMLGFPWQIEYTEGFILGYTADWLDGRPLYQPIDEPPYRIMAYVPLYFFLNSLLIPVTGVSFWGGRMISMAASIAIAGVIFFILRRCGGIAGYRLPLLGMGIWLTGRYVYRYTQFYRPDTLAILLVLLALLIAWRYKSGSGQLWALTVAIIAVFVKQNHVGIIVAILWDAFSRDRGRGLRLTLFTTATIGGILVAGDSLTNGQFIRQVVGFNFYNQFNWEHGIALLLLAFAKYSVPLFIIGLEFRQSLKEGSLDLLHRYMLLVLVFTLTVGKMGSQVHYFLEFTAVLAVALPRAVARLETQAGYRLIAAIMPVLLLFSVITINANNRGIATAREPNQTEAEAGALLAEAIRKTDGPIVSEDAGMLVLTDRDIYIDPFLCSQLAHFNVWNEAPFLEDISQGRFPLLILEFDLDDPTTIGWHKYRFTPAMLAAFRQHYRLVSSYRTHDPLFLYRLISSEGN